MLDIAIITTNEDQENFFVEASTELTQAQKDALVEFTIFYKGNIAIRFEVGEKLKVVSMTLLDIPTSINVVENFYCTMHNPGVSENITL